MDYRSVAARLSSFGLLVRCSRSRGLASFHSGWVGINEGAAPTVYRAKSSGRDCREWVPPYWQGVASPRLGRWESTLHRWGVPVQSAGLASAVTAVGLVADDSPVPDDDGGVQSIVPRAPLGCEGGGRAGSLWCVLSTSRSGPKVLLVAKER